MLNKQACSVHSTWMLSNVFYLEHFRFTTHSFICWLCNVFSILNSENRLLVMIWVLKTKFGIDTRIHIRVWIQEVYDCVMPVSILKVQHENAFYEMKVWELLFCRKESAHVSLCFVKYFWTLEVILKFYFCKKISTKKCKEKTPENNPRLNYIHLPKD